MNAARALALGSLAVAAVFCLSTAQADGVRDSFERDLHRAPTPVSATVVVAAGDALQQAVHAATWTQPEQQVPQSFLRDLHRAPTASVTAQTSHAETDPMLVQFNRLLHAEDRDVLARSGAR